MAESNEEAGGWWGHDWGGWLKTVQEKSGQALEQMKKDLGEFGSTIQKDTAQAAASTATLIKEKLKVPEDEDDVTTTARMKIGFSNLLTGLSQSLTPSEKTERGEDVVPIAQKDPHIFDKARARLHAMQTDPTTYCSDPDGHPDFREWLESFNVESYKGDISELLVANTEVRALYTKLVPAAVSHVEFWGRYLYRVQQLKQDEARRRALKERAEMTSSQKFEEEDLGWGDEDETWDTMPEATKNQSGVERFVVLPQDAEQRLSECGAEGETKSQVDQPNRSSADQPEQLRSDRPVESNSMMQDSETSSQIAKEQTIPSQMPTTSATDSKTTDQKVESTVSSTRTDENLETIQGQKQEPSRESKSMERKEEAESNSSDPTQVSSTAEDGAESLPPKEAVVAAETERKSDTDMVTHKSKDTLKLEELTVETPGAEDGKTVETEQTSPVASEASNRESSLSDDWEKDFDDIEVTEEDMKNASTKLMSTVDDDLDDDWESWE
ncbi:BSD domain-containing protein 1-like [Diadema antillarum]|uniref:BSD domain-containing protein 1-like n=1 Tax=Diadema antillarum TaxID=105358 RepID=UPI003A83EE32